MAGPSKFVLTERHRDFVDRGSQQEKVLELSLQGWSPKEIGEKLGMLATNVSRARKAIFDKGLAVGYDPRNGLGDNVLPTGQVLAGLTTYQKRNAEGGWEDSHRYVKSAVDKQVERNDQLVAVMRAAAEDWKGLGKRIKAPNKISTRRSVVIPMGDPHLGMLSWAPETGDDFNLTIAKDQLEEAVGRLVQTAPSCIECVILNLGDFFHSHDDTARTKQSGHSLDLDGRWGKVYLAGVHAMVACVDHARRHHKRVVVKNLIGNHDDHISLTLGVALHAWFHNDPRVHVDISPAAIWYYQFHRVMVAATHGDKIKPSEIGGVMACDQPKMWADTTKRYAYFGHVHHSSKGVANESPGVQWETFRTLAAKDAWHAAQRYRSGRDMYGIVMDRDHGEVERHRVDVSMLSS